jgi:hypothetical protein
MKNVLSFLLSRAIFALELLWIATQIVVVGVIFSFAFYGIMYVSLIKLH